MAPAVRRPRGRYHCGVWLTMPSRAETASRRSPAMPSTRSSVRAGVEAPPRRVPLRGGFAQAERGRAGQRAAPGDALAALGRARDEPLEALARLADVAPRLTALDDVALLLEDEHVVAVLDDA